MTKARTEQVSLEDTPFYHCYVRCVRRAYLCGDDHASGANYDHRKQWIVSRLRFLSYIYAIDVCAYAVMSNHYHVVLHVDGARAQAWSWEEVVERWMQLYNGDVLVDRWLREGDALDAPTLAEVEAIIEEWRERLCSLSWFMRGINETIARMANAEEKCTGRFWEGRFKSQALLDEVAVLSCMAYVDLNPVRAGVENDLIDSDFTSIQQRLYDIAQRKRRKNASEKMLSKRVLRQNQLRKELEMEELPEAPLMPFDGSAHSNIHSGLPFTEADYLELVDTTGRAVRDDKRGFIASDIPPILQRLGLDANEWLQQLKRLNTCYGQCIGTVDSMRSRAAHINRCWVKGVRAASLVSLQ